MSVFWKRTLLGLVVLVVVILAVLRYQKIQTKKASPEETVAFYVGGPEGVQVEVDYSRPYKKGRVIFGGLVPFGKVWRTGANEATTFSVNKDITFGGVPVKAGKYTLWTLPGEDAWAVYLNGRMYSWGVDMDGVAQRDPEADIAAVKIPVDTLAEEVEQFRIAVDTDKDPVELTLIWDRTKVAIPITY
ncbi:MAG: DUF2911 domain-containing protein [Flavobacteriales bacterium]|nr:DUF2911 domain-containing protein [Flavobacteriales bacterium]